MSDRTSTATFSEAIDMVAARLWLRREAEHEMVCRIDKGQPVFAEQLREAADRRLVEAMAIAEAVSVIYATYYDEVVDLAYEVMSKQYGDSSDID